MQLASYFQPNRFLYLLKKDTLFDHKRTWMMAGVLFTIGLITIISWAYDGDNDTAEFHVDTFGALLLIGGFIYTASAFKELDETNTAHLYLSLPASNFEKFFSKFLTTTIGFAFGFTLFYWIFSLLTNGIVEGYFDMDMEPFRPFSDHNGFLFKLFFVIQPLFLLGAIIFRKYAAAKTVFAVLLLEIVLAIIGYLLMRIVFFDFFEGWKLIGPGIEAVPSKGFEDFVSGPLKNIGEFMFWYVLPVFFWVVCYFKLSEKEI